MDTSQLIKHYESGEINFNDLITIIDKQQKELLNLRVEVMDLKQCNKNLAKKGYSYRRPSLF